MTLRVARLFAISALLGSAAFASNIYITGDDGSNLYTLDPSTATSQLVGSFGQSGVYADAFDPNGNLWALTNGYNSGTLATVDLATGAATLVGSGSGVAGLMAMAFASNGTLYVGSWDTNALYTMDTSTGAVATVGSLGFTGLMGFDFDQSGDMFAIASGGFFGPSDLYSINLSTGAGTLVTPIAADSCLMGLSIDSSNRFLATDYCTLNSPLYQIDPATGNLTNLGSTGLAQAMGGDFNDLASVSSPEPSALLLAVSGGVLCFIQRRRKARPGPEALVEKLGTN